MGAIRQLHDRFPEDANSFKDVLSRYEKDEDFKKDFDPLSRNISKKTKAKLENAAIAKIMDKTTSALGLTTYSEANYRSQVKDLEMVLTDD